MGRQRGRFGCVRLRRCQNGLRRFAMPPGRDLASIRTFLHGGPWLRCKLLLGGCSLREWSGA